MENHYARKLDAVMEWMADDVMWIGPVHNEYIFGKRAVKRILAKEQDVQCEIDDSFYEIISGTEELCVTTGQLSPRTTDDSGLVLGMLQRVTFIFKLIDQVPRVIHMHISCEWDGVENDETFPFHLGREAFAHMQKKIAEQSGDLKKLAIRDVHHDWHYIIENEILYISADNIHSVIYTLKGRFPVPVPISELHKRLSGTFVRVHRSFIVNADYAVKICRFAVHLYNDIKIPIPQKRFTQIKQQLLLRANGLTHIY